MGGLFSADAWETVWRYRSTFLHGLGNTVQLAVFALLLSLMLGILFGLMSAGGPQRESMWNLFRTRLCCFRCVFCIMPLRFPETVSEF